MLAGYWSALTACLETKLIFVGRILGPVSGRTERHCFNAQCAGAAVQWDVNAMFAREAAGWIRCAGIMTNVLRVALPGIYSLSKETLFANECLEDVTCVLNMVNRNLNTSVAARPTFCRWLVLNKEEISFILAKRLSGHAIGLISSYVQMSFCAWSTVRESRRAKQAQPRSLVRGTRIVTALAKEPFSQRGLLLFMVETK
jgi:hypothetical protein